MQDADKMRKNSFNGQIDCAPQEIFHAPLSPPLYYFEARQTAQAEKVFAHTMEQIEFITRPLTGARRDSYLSAVNLIATADILSASLPPTYPDDLSVQRTYIQLLIINNAGDEQRRGTCVDANL